MADKKLLEHRKRMKSKKPAMIRQDWYKKTRLAEVWRRPKGLHSKLRHRRKERTGLVEPGWGSPCGVKGLHSSGLEFVIVNSIAALEKIAKDSQGILIAGAVGDKKKIEILKIAIQKKITVLNIKNSAEWLAGKEIGMEQRKKAKLAKLAKPEAAKPAEKKDIATSSQGLLAQTAAKKAEQQKPAESKKQEEKHAPQTDEEKKEAEKQEKDKLLIKRAE
jgi:large subunit ribosomal protein L32e